MAIIKNNHHLETVDMIHLIFDFNLCSIYFDVCT